MLLVIGTCWENNLYGKQYNYLSLVALKVLEFSPCNSKTIEKLRDALNKLHKSNNRSLIQVPRYTDQKEINRRTSWQYVGCKNEVCRIRNDSFYFKEFCQKYFHTMGRGKKALVFSKSTELTSLKTNHSQFSQQNRYCARRRLPFVQKG